MDISQESVAQLARRRALFARVTIARNASSHGTAERARLEDVCKRSAERLTESANEVLISIDDRAPYLYGPLKKWRLRLTRELSSLRCSSDHLSVCLKGTGIYASAYDVFPENVVLGKHKTMESRIAADELDKARQACAYVSREIPVDLSAQLRTDKNHRRFNDAVSVVSNVLRKVKRYEKQVSEELAMLAAADAEMQISIIRARDATKCVPPTSTLKKQKNEVAMLPSAHHVDLKGALGLLIALS